MKESNDQTSLMRDTKVDDDDEDDDEATAAVADDNPITFLAI